MRLLKRESSGRTRTSNNFSLTEFRPSNVPSKYAILSHRWGNDEITLRDLESGTAQSKPGGYRKLDFCADQAAHDGIDYFWIDTCCINKESSAELSEAINSMFKWYQNAAKCYVYLPDVSFNLTHQTTTGDHTWVSSFQASTWFTRGWTLQELIAPRVVEFFSIEGTRFGDKTSLEQQIHHVTKIPIEALRGSPLPQFTPEERFGWATERRTTVEEDAAYCLLGLFDVHMPLIYGEGQQNALARLRRKVEKSTYPVSTKATSHLRTVPFERNPRFTGRETELTKLEAQLSASDHTSIWAVTGLGGVGKTQLILELLYRTQTKHLDYTIMWIPAASRESLHQGYSAVARQLEIPGCENENADIETLVHHHLAKVDVGRWLLVFDNADDINLWTAVSALPNQEPVPQPTRQTSCLIDRLPRNKRGCIFFTTRDRKLATRLAGPNILNVPEMGEETAKGLLGKYLSDPNFLVDHQHDAAKLLEELMYLPLAIVQAATYIIENGITVAEYVQLLEEKEEEVIDLLSVDFEDHGRYRDIKNPITTTWLISFEQIRKHDQLAAEYLSFMACIHPKDIPQSLLPRGPSRQRELEAIGTLTAYSFVSRRPADDFLNLHRLVHLATRNWLRKEEALSSWRDRTMIRLEEVFPDSDDRNRDVWRMYLPHALQILESDGLYGGEKRGIALMSKCGKCLHVDGRWDEAEMLFVHVLREIKSCTVEDESTDLLIKSWLAETYRMQGHWREAEELQIEVLEKDKTNLGTDHPHTLSSMHNLALTYHEQGYWKEAEQLQIEVTEKHKTQLGTDHPRTLASMHNLAFIYQEQGRWSEAEQLLVEVLGKSKTGLGADHTDTLSTMDHLAKLYRNQRRLSEAEPLLVEVLEKRKVRLGIDHPNTINTMAHLAKLYRNQHRFSEAEELLVEALKKSKVTLGADHPDTLSAMDHLAKLYRNQRRLSEAEQLLVEVLEKSKMRLGTDHPDTISTTALLAKLYGDQNRLVEAEALEVRVLETSKRKLGINHPDTLTSMHNLACRWMTLGRDEEAIQLMKDCAQRSPQVIGVQHPDYLSSVTLLNEWEAERSDRKGTRQSTQMSIKTTAMTPRPSNLIVHNVQGSTTSLSGNGQRKVKLSHRVRNFLRSSPKAGSSSRG